MKMQWVEANRAQDRDNEKYLGEYRCEPENVGLYEGCWYYNKVSGRCYEWSAVEDEKPHFDFSRRPDSGSKLIADLDHIKMMTDAGKSRYVHGCYTEEDAKNVIAHFNANPQFTKELRIKSYEQSGSDVYIFYKKRTANDWHELGELPPAGTECEIAASTEYLTIGYPEGTKVKIYANFTDDRGVKLAAFVDSIGKVVGVATAKCFRPLKTERERAIEEIAAVTGLRGRDGRDVVAAAIYDAGYRKEGK